VGTLKILEKMAILWPKMGVCEYFGENVAKNGAFVNSFKVSFFRRLEGFMNEMSHRPLKS
jgi:hypothetical protein